MSILQAFEWIRKQFTTIHILICNAGILKSNFLTGKLSVYFQYNENRVELELNMCFY